MKKKALERVRNIAFVQGFACATATNFRHYGDKVEARELLKCVSLKEVLKYAEPYDLEVLQPLIEELSTRR